MDNKSVEDSIVKDSTMNNELISAIMRQTNYTREEATIALDKHNTLEAVIKDYLGVVDKPSQPVSVNQGIFKSIRQFIDQR